MANEIELKADHLRVLAGKAARWLQRSVAHGEHQAARGEVLAFGALSAPVLLELGALLSKAEREALVRQMSLSLTEDHQRRQKQWRALEQVSRMVDRRAMASQLG